jgi:hypothetical protein
MATGKYTCVITGGTKKIAEALKNAQKKEG